MIELTETLRYISLSESPGRLRATVFRGAAFEVHPLPGMGEVTVGRGTVADIVIDHASISRVHAILTLTPKGTVEVEDAGSSNGTIVRGKKLTEGQRVTVTIGEAIELGQAIMIVHGAVAANRPRRLWSHGDFEARLEEECARAADSGATFTLARLRAPDTAPLLLP